MSKFATTFTAKLWALPVAMLRALISLYQRLLSPVLGAAFPSCGCRFAPTCSHYAREALLTHGLGRGSALTALRLLKCGPWHSGGLDPVPPRARPTCQRVSA